LIQAVREGRKREFADFVSTAEEIPLPDAIETFESAKLSWSWPRGSMHEGVRNLYRDLLEARHVWPAAKEFASRNARLIEAEGDATVLELVRGPESLDAKSRLHAYFNLSHRPTKIPDHALDGAQKILFASESPRYGGSGPSNTTGRHLLPFECVVIGPSAWPFAAQISRG
jgi:maltooligosyltrehalose trehalohydrolase